jgi:hypothetical protein
MYGMRAWDAIRIHTLKSDSARRSIGIFLSCEHLRSRVYNSPRLYYARAITAADGRVFYAKFYAVGMGDLMVNVPNGKSSTTVLSCTMYYITTLWE